MRVLYTTPVLEHPAAGGAQLRVENSIKALALACELDVISRQARSITGGEEAEAFFRGLCREFHVAPFAARLSGNRYVRKIQRLLGSWIGREIAGDARFICEHIDRRGIETIWFGFGNISFRLIKRIGMMRPDVRLICDTDSVWSRFLLRRLDYVKGLEYLNVLWAGKRKEREEREWTNHCAITTAVSEVDAQYYRSLAAEPSHVRIFSNVIDLETYREPPPPPPGFHKPCIYLAGVFGHANSPMDVAARWVLEEVLPRVRAQVPEVHFYIVGKHSERMFGHLNDPNITVTGALPSVLPYLCHADVALVPLKFESGTRFKILEAGACRVPLVSTTLGAEGLPVAHGEHLLIADTPEEFAKAIVGLLDNKAYAAQLAENCYQLVCRDYSIATLQREAQEILETL